MIWTGWNNGKHHSTGAGYGFKVKGADRDRYFKCAWQTVFIELPTRPGSATVKVNVAKQSFWGLECHELISKDIGRWMLAEKYEPWRRDVPPKFEVEFLGERLFRLKKPAGL